MKQRPLTKIQLTVLTMKLAGNGNYAISQVVGIHPDTVSNKWTAIQKGIAKGAYNNLPDTLNSTGDLFSEVNNPVVAGIDRTTSGAIGQP